MTTFDCIRMAFGNVFRHRLRSFLCGVSIAIGILSIVLISVMGDTGKYEIRKQLDSLGISGLTVYIKDKEPAQVLPAFAAMGIQDNVNGVASTMPVITKIGAYRTDRKSGSTVIWGISETFKNTLDVKLLAGRFPTKNDVKFNSRVAVIDKNLAEELYKRTNIVGKTIKLTINNYENNYKIIGVIEPQTGIVGNILGNQIPAFVYVPYSLMESSGVDQIMIKCSDNSDLTAITNQIKDYLRLKEKIPGEITIQNMSGYMGVVENIAALVAMVFSFVAAVSLFVAVVGVVNSMLSAATERRQEIGIYMALGAKKQDILKCFLLESILLCGIGGAFGGVIGLLLLYFAEFVLQKSFLIHVEFILVSMAVAMICGGIAGVFPAKKAANMSPIDAIRR